MQKKTEITFFQTIDKNSRPLSAMPSGTTVVPGDS